MVSTDISKLWFTQGTGYRVQGTGYKVSRPWRGCCDYMLSAGAVCEAKGGGDAKVKMRPDGLINAFAIRPLTHPVLRDGEFRPESTAHGPCANPRMVSPKLVMAMHRKRQSTLEIFNRLHIPS